MSDADEVTQYYFVELWQYESGKLGWSLKDANGEPIVKAEAANLALEMGEWLLAEDGEIVASMFLESSGRVHVRRAPSFDVSRCETFVWLKRRMRASTLRYVDAFAPPGRLYDWYSHAEWLWHKLRGHFKASQSARAAAATPAPATPADTVSDASEGRENSSAQAGGNVLAFRPPPRCREPSL